MSKYIGRRVNIGVAKEAVRGAGAVATRWVPKVDYTFWDKTDKATSEESFSHINGFGAHEIVTSQHAGGDLEGEINLKSYPLFLLATFGGLSSAASGAGYKHTITLTNSNQHQSLAITTVEDNGDRMFKNCVVDTHEITINPEEIVKFTLGLLSKKPVDTDGTASYETVDYKVVGRQLELKVAADTASLAASSKIYTKELTLTISKNAELDKVNGTLEPEDIHNKQFTIEGSLTLNFEDSTWREYMTAGTYRAMGIKLTNGTDLGGGVYPEFYIELPKVAFSEWEKESGNDDIVTQTLNFKALYDQSTSKVISDCYVINDVATY